MENNNLEYIEVLKKLVNYFKTHPNLPKINNKYFFYHLGTKDELLQAARFMGSFEKSVDDYNYNIEGELEDGIKVQFYISRDVMCKKVITWECPDESLLESFNNLTSESLNKE